MSGVHAAGGDVLDALERHAHALACPRHRPREQVVGSNVRERSAVAAHGRAHATEDECVSHGLRPSFRLLVLGCESALTVAAPQIVAASDRDFLDSIFLWEAAS